MIKREIISLALQECTPDATDLVLSLTDEMINEYEKILNCYQSGDVVENGWQQCIESRLLDMGVSDRLAFGLAVCRNSVHIWKEKWVATEWEVACE